MNLSKQTKNSLLDSLFFIPWEKDLLEEVYKKYNTGLLILAYMAIIGQTYFSIIDLQSQNTYSGSLRLSNIFVCILYIFFFNKINTKSSIDWHLLVITNFYLVEVEVEIFSDGDLYYEPSTWLMIPILMMYHAFYFKNIPQKFILYWFIMLIYYYIRVALSPVSSFFSVELMSVLGYFIPSFIVACMFNYLWMQKRYTNQLYLRNLENETSKRIEIEKELAVQIAKEAMIDDIHDLLGSAVLDMKWKINFVMQENNFPTNLSQKIQIYIYLIEDALRLNINSIADQKTLIEDFFEGLRVILFRRYEILQRNIMFDSSSLNSNVFLELQNSIKVQKLVSICMDICTNDLKNGEGISNWIWNYDGKLNLSFNMITHNKNEDFKSLFESLENRIFELNGVYSSFIEKEKFHLKIQLPLYKV